MKLAEADILILPGLGGPKPGHWQMRWAERMANAQIVDQQNWFTPDRDDWVEAIENAVRRAVRPVVLVAHSTSVAAVVHAAPRLPATVRGAFLVAPTDIELSPIAPEATHVFRPIPREPLAFPSMVVASSTDTYVTLERAVEFANCWGSDFHQAGDAGHLNLDSGHGPWPEGLLMFTRLMQRLTA